MRSRLSLTGRACPAYGVFSVPWFPMSGCVLMQSPSGVNVGFPSVDRAAQLLARLGFELVHGDRHEAPGGALLVVALRDEPTLEHFDPEQVEYWVTADGRGRPATVDRKTDAPVERPFAWGTIRVVDRLEVSNSFLTFGGRLRVQVVNPGLTLVMLASPAPILRWMGHSQGIDPLGTEVGAFFARLKVPIDFTPGAEAWVGEANPLALYAAAIGDLRERFARIRGLQDLQPVLARQTSHERHWLEETAPAEWEAGQELRQKLGMAPSGSAHPGEPLPAA